MGEELNGDFGLGCGFEYICCVNVAWFGVLLGVVIYMEYGSISIESVI